MAKRGTTNFHILANMLNESQNNYFMTPILRKGLRVLQHLRNHGVVEGRKLILCTHKFCMRGISKLLYKLTNHEDGMVRELAHSLQKLQFEMPRKWHISHVAICEQAKLRAAREQAMRDDLEEGEILEF